MGRPPAEAGAAPGGARWVPLLLGLFIVTMIAALVFGLNAGTRLGGRYTPLLDAVFHVKLNVTSAHLWIEEVVAGDPNESVDEIRLYLDAADSFIDAVLDGDLVDRLPLVLLTEPGVKPAFATLRRQLAELREISQRRLELLGAASAGSAIDQRYDQVFRRIIALADEIEAGLELAVSQDLERFQQVQVALILASVVLFVFVVWLIRRQFAAQQREIDQRRRTEAKLVRSEAAAVQARDQADAANQAKSLFLAKMSHEIRTPIGAVMGMAHMLEDSQLSAEQREYVRIIGSSSGDLLEIINDLLDFSRIESGKLTLKPVVFDLRQTVADITDLMNVKARDRGLVLSAAIPADFPPRLFGDPVRIRQVLLNLLRNAIKFTDEGRIEVALEHRSLGPGRVQVGIGVSDTGIGIPEAKRAEIFEAFAQVDDGSSRQYGGAGLGLSICRQLCGLMDGRIELDSEFGQGSRFRVQLPMRMEQAAVSDATAELAAGGVRVLVADSDLQNGRCTGTYLDQLQVAHELTDNPAQILTRLLEGAPGGGRYAALLLSLPMPELDLPALCRDIRNDPALAEIGLLVIAPWCEPRATAKFAELGVNAVLTQAQRALALGSLLYRAIRDRGPPRGEVALSAGFAHCQAAAPAQVARAKFDATVLLVEDNPVTQWAASHMLKSLGCRVDMADNGAQALQRWARRPYDVIFMDWQMPDMDGFEVTARIRAQETARRTPIVALTANAMLGDREKCLAAGMDDYLSKPVFPEGLERVLSAFAAERRQAAVGES